MGKFRCGNGVYLVFVQSSLLPASVRKSSTTYTLQHCMSHPGRQVVEQMETAMFSYFFSIVINVPRSTLASGVDSVPPDPACTLSCMCHRVVSFFFLRVYVCVCDERRI